MPTRKKIVTVTGATGFVGRVLVKRLTNEPGAANVFRACPEAGVSKVVQVSTPLAYGVPDQIPFDEDTPAGIPVIMPEANTWETRRAGICSRKRACR